MLIAPFKNIVYFSQFHNSNFFLLSLLNILNEFGIEKSLL